MRSILGSFLPRLSNALVIQKSFPHAVQKRGYFHMVDLPQWASAMAPNLTVTAAHIRHNENEVLQFAREINKIAHQKVKEGCQDSKGMLSALHNFKHDKSCVAIAVRGMRGLRNEQKEMLMFALNYQMGYVILPIEDRVISSVNEYRRALLFHTDNPYNVDTPFTVKTLNLIGYEVAGKPLVTNVLEAEKVVAEIPKYFRYILEQQIFRGVSNYHQSPLFKMLYRDEDNSWKINFFAARKNNLSDDELYEVVMPKNSIYTEEEVDEAVLSLQKTLIKFMRNNKMTRFLISSGNFKKEDVPSGVYEIDGLIADNQRCVHGRGYYQDLKFNLIPGEVHRKLGRFFTVENSDMEKFSLYPSSEITNAQARKISNLNQDRAGLVN